MARTSAIVIETLIIITLVVTACSYQTSRYERAFHSTNDGDGIDLVIRNFGTPSVRELPEKPYTRYARSACSGPCAQRIWREHPVLKGFEAWSIEFNVENKVESKEHGVSP